MPFLSLVESLHFISTFLMAVTILLETIKDKINAAIKKTIKPIVLLERFKYMNEDQTKKR